MPYSIVSSWIYPTSQGMPVPPIQTVKGYFEPCPLICMGTKNFLSSDQDYSVVAINLCPTTAGAARQRQPAPTVAAEGEEYRRQLEDR